MKKKISACLFLIFYILLDQSSFAQRDNFSIGDLDFISSGKKTKDLLYKASVGLVSFHKYVGGISFEQVAVPENNIRNQEIDLNYIHNADGKRLQIKIGNSIDSIYYPAIADWQLIPIAFYANDSNNAVFTLTGNISNPYTDSRIQYHPAFKNQLLGLRMLQADLLFASSGGGQLAGLPKDNISNELLIADTEKKFKLDTNNLFVYDDLKEELTYACPEYSSYILTDWGKEISFGVSGKNFFITGEPYYLFTTKEKDNVSWLYELRNTLISLKNGIPFSNDPDYVSMSNILKKQKIDKSDFSRISDILEKLSGKYNEPYKSWFKNKYYDFRWYYSEYADRIVEEFKNSMKMIKPGSQLLNDTDFNSLIDLLQKDIYTWTIDEADLLLDNLKMKYSYTIRELLLPYTESEKIKLMLCGSQSMEDINKKIFDFNPVVFNSCITTMRFAAFFRYVKMHEPEHWQKFINQINKFYGKYILPTSNKKSVLNEGIITPDEIKRHHE
ncbi:MAG: hypothetical protein QM737_16700 [Ferruginibacter sp.]